MNYKIKFSSSFKKSYEKRIKPNAILLKKCEEKLNIFIDNPYDPRLKTHKLSGKLENILSFSFDYDCRIIFYFEENEIILIDIGSHDEVY